MDTVLEGVRQHGLDGNDLVAVLISHIHLDHAGACGRLAQQFSNLKFYVHERGAPHLANPDRLLRSAEKLYGDDMERLWGKTLPVPEDRIVVLKGGEALKFGDRAIEVAYTPGHASHHVTYFDDSDRAAYTGDVGGMKFTYDFVIPPTPPPDIDLKLWFDSIDHIEAREPAKLRLAHYGEVDDVGDHLLKLRQRLETWSNAVERIVLERPVDPVSIFTDAIREDLLHDANRQQVNEYVDETHFSPEQQYLGLERYWRKRHNY